MGCLEEVHPTGGAFVSDPRADPSPGCYEIGTTASRRTSCRALRKRLRGQMAPLGPPAGGTAQLNIGRYQLRPSKSPGLGSVSRLDWRSR